MPLLEYTFYKVEYFFEMEYEKHFETMDYDPRLDESQSSNEYFYVELPDGSSMYSVIPMMWQCDFKDGEYWLKEKYLPAYKWDREYAKSEDENTIDKLFKEQKDSKKIHIIEIKYDDLPRFAKQTFEMYLKENGTNNES